MPPRFLFSVKVPKTITHKLRLLDAAELFDVFLAEISILGESVGCLLVQLPPSLQFEAQIAREFFTMARARVAVSIACEPRHESWFADDADELLASFSIARVAADPARVPAAAHPGGWRGMSYYRLHGSPKVYYSSYDNSFLAALARGVADDTAAGRTAWVIFDNTTLGAATANALQLTDLLTESTPR